MKGAKFTALALLLLAAALGSGCMKAKRKTTMIGWINHGEWTPFKHQPDVRRKEYIMMHPEVDPDFKQCILEGAVLEGMNMTEAEASWGAPTEKEIKTGNDGLVYESWWYMRGADEYQVLLFRDGFLEQIVTKKE